MLHRQQTAFTISRAACPFLPPARPDTDYRYLRELGDVRDGRFYLRALVYGQTLWQNGHSARAILAVTRGLYADLGADPSITDEWPLPYGALAWLVAMHPGDSFLGNPRISFQHQADRVRGPRAHQKSARAWATWHLIRTVRPDLPADVRHRVEEPTLAMIRERLDTFGIPGERQTWEIALERAKSGFADGSTS